MLSEVALLSAHLNLNLSKARSVRKYKYISPAFPSCGESFVSESGSILMAPRASEFTHDLIFKPSLLLTAIGGELECRRLSNSDCLESDLYLAIMERPALAQFIPR